MPIEARFADRVRKRQERRKEAEAAVAKRAAADAELRAKLLAATGGNYTPGPGIDDLAPLKRAPGLVPLDRLLSGIGRASCRGRGEISGGAGSLKKKKKKKTVYIVIRENKKDEDVKAKNTTLLINRVFHERGTHIQGVRVCITDVILKERQNDIAID